MARDGKYTQFGDQIGNTDTTPEQRRKAAISVAAISGEKDDTKMLLDMLGLSDAG